MKNTTKSAIPKVRRVIIGVIFMAISGLSSIVDAALVRVNWSADIPELNSPNPGPGRLSGSLGVFNVTSVGQTFLLPSDGSLTAIASGFDSDEFRNGAYSFTRTHSSGAPQLQFLSFGSNPSDFSVNFIDMNTGLLSGLESFTVDGLSGYIFVVLFDQSGSGIDRASAVFSTSGATPPSSPISYSFTMVPEPATLTVFAIGSVMAMKRKK